MVALSSSVNAMRFIQSRLRQEPERDREQEQVQVQEEAREQGKAQEPVVVDAVASTSTFVFASIGRPNGRRCSTMVGAR
jgi:hypothetical protein